MKSVPACEGRDTRTVSPATLTTLRSWVSWWSPVPTAAAVVPQHLTALAAVTAHAYAAPRLAAPASPPARPGHLTACGIGARAIAQAVRSPRPSTSLRLCP